VSEFVKRLEQISREKGQPLGFGTATKTKSPLMMLVAQLPQAEVGLTTSAISNGADSLLFALKSSNGTTQALATIASSIGQVPWGMQVETADQREINELAEVGCDYLVFRPEVSAQIIGEKKMGKVLEVDISLSDSLARAAGQLHIDAVLLDSRDASPLTLHRLMQYQRIINFAGKPAIVFLPPSAMSGDLARLWEVGVRGAVIDLGIKPSKQKLSQMREAIKDLPVTKRKSGERISAILPTLGLPEEDFEEEI